MDIEELRQKQTDAINVLKRFGTIDALEWLMACRPSENQNFIFKTSGHWSGMEIKRHLSFQTGDSTYDLYLMNERTYVTAGGEETMGVFQFYFESSLALETRYHERMEYDLSTKKFISYYELDWSVSRDVTLANGRFVSNPGEVKTIKLSEWIETLPNIVEKQKRKIQSRSKNDREEQNKKIVSESADNFDLGKYK